MDDIHQTIEETFREQSGRVLAGLIGRFQDFELAEDVLQEALITALEKWPQVGIPRNPAAWLTTIAQRKAIDRLRRRQNYTQKQALLQSITDLNSARSHEDEVGTIPDERLKLIFTCCHPALSPEAQIALTLRTLGGLSTTEIASAFMTTDKTMAQRLVRAKRKIKKAGIPYRVPPPELLAERLEAALGVIYLIFNEGYNASRGEVLIRGDLCREAIRLGMVLNELLAAEMSLTEDAEALGLLALMLLHDSRRAAREGENGELVLLEEQDRGLWDGEKIGTGLALLDRAMGMRQPGVYQIQAAISALHVQAVTPEGTDWAQIALLYGELYRLRPTAVIALNRAVAVGMADGLMRGVTLLDELHGRLDDYHLYHAARADLLRRGGWLDEAQVAYERALNLVQNGVERQFLQRRLQEVRN